MEQSKEQMDKTSPKESNAKPAHLTATGLKLRGWTDTLIKNFLGDPDRTAENRHYKSGPPVRLYKLSRVEAVESSDEFKQAHGKAQERSRRQKAVAQEQSKKLLQKVSEMPITVDLLPLDKVLDDAIRHFNAHPKRERDNRGADKGSDQPFLDRIMVNHIRHNLTHYDKFLDEVERKTAAMDARELINQRIYDAIAQEYPDLGTECDRQFIEKVRQFDYDRFSRDL